MKTETTVTAWIGAFEEDIKQYSENTGKLYLSVARTLLAILPLIKLEFDHYNNAIEYLIGQVFRLVVKTELRRANADEIMVNLIILGMINITLGLHGTPPEEIAKIKEYLEKECQEQNKKIKNTLTELLQKEFGEEITFNALTSEYREPINENTLQRAKFIILKSNNDEIINISYTDIPKQKLTDIIRNHYITAEYEEMDTNGATDGMMFYHHHDERLKTIGFTWDKNKSMIDVIGS